VATGLVAEHLAEANGLSVDGILYAVGVSPTR
jgi:hypothetical protein